MLTGPNAFEISNIGSQSYLDDQHVTMLHCVESRRMEFLRTTTTPYKNADLLPACDELWTRSFLHPHSRRLRRVVHDDCQDVAKRRSGDHRPHRRTGRKGERLAVPELECSCRRFVARLALNHVHSFDAGMMMTQGVHPGRERG